MKKCITLMLALCLSLLASAQQKSAIDYFISGGKEFVDNNTDKALGIVEEGLSKYPKDEKLKKLYAKLKKKKQEEEKKKKEEQDKQKQQQKQQDKQQNKPQQGNNTQQQSDQQKQQQQQKEEKQKAQKQPQPGEMSKEEAQRLLDALGSEETKVQEEVNKKKAKPVIMNPKQKDW